MSKDLQHIKEIDDYLSGQLPPESRNDFEEKLRHDVDLQEEVDTIKKVIEGIEGFAFKKMLQEIHDRQSGKE